MIFSIDFSSSYTFWAFSVASFNLVYSSLLISVLSLSSLTSILAVSRGKRRFAFSVASFLAVWSASDSLGLLPSLLTGLSTLSLGLLPSLLTGLSTLSLGLFPSLLTGLSTLSLGLLPSLLTGLSTLSLGLFPSLLTGLSTLSLGLFSSAGVISFNPLTALSISFNISARVSSKFLVSLALLMNSVALVITAVKLLLDSSEYLLVAILSCADFTASSSLEVSYLSIVEYVWTSLNSFKISLDLGLLCIKSSNLSIFSCRKLSTAFILASLYFLLSLSELKLATASAFDCLSWISKSYWFFKSNRFVNAADISSELAVVFFNTFWAAFILLPKFLITSKSWLTLAFLNTLFQLS